MFSSFLQDHSSSLSSLVPVQLLSSERTGTGPSSGFELGVLFAIFSRTLTNSSHVVKLALNLETGSGCILSEHIIEDILSMTIYIRSHSATYWGQIPGGFYRLRILMVTPEVKGRRRTEVTRIDLTAGTLALFEL